MAPTDHFRPFAKNGTSVILAKSPNFCAILGEFGPYGYRDWGFFDVAAARVSDSMCDFGRNWRPMDVAIGIPRRRDRPSFRRHVRFRV